MIPTTGQEEDLGWCNFHMISYDDSLPCCPQCQHEDILEQRVQDEMQDRNGQ